MAINASTAPSGGGVKQAPIAIGSHVARLVQVIDLGMQPQSWGNQVKEPARKINLTYELGYEFMKDTDGNEDKEKPRWIGEDFVLHNLSADLAKSTKRCNALDPEGKYKGDFAKMLGEACTITVVHNKGNNGNIYANISLVSPVVKGMAVPALKNQPKVFDLDNPDLEVFKSLPSFIQNKILGGVNYPGSKLAHLLDGEVEGEAKQQEHGGEDEIPF